MKKLTRLALIGATGAGALAFAGPALAAFTPKLDVSVPNGLGATGSTRIHLAAVIPGTGTQETTARIVVYAPAGFTVNMPTPVATIGTIDARVRAGDLGGAIVPVTGTIEARPASGSALVSGVPIPLATLATQCTGTATHAGFWIFKLSAAGQTLELATYFDTTTGAEAALGSGKLTFCLPPDDVPAGTPGRSPLGIKLVDALLTFTSTYVNASSAGTYVWTSIWTPYNPGVGTANAAGTVTAISINGLPVQATLKAKYDKKKKTARLSGRISAAGQLQAGLKLPLFSGSSKAKLKRAGSTNKTTGTGAFTALRRIIKATFFQVRFAIPAVDFTAQGCAAVPAPPALPPCVSATVGAFSALTNIVKVVPKK